MTRSGFSGKVERGVTLVGVQNALLHCCNEGVALLFFPFPGTVMEAEACGAAEAVGAPSSAVALPRLKQDFLHRELIHHVHTHS